MPIDISEVDHLLEEIRTAAKPVAEAHAWSEKQRHELILTAERLAIAARTPEENTYHLATQIAQNAAVRSAIAMGAFETIPSNGTSISADEIATKLQVNKGLLVRLLRACCSTHILLETGDETYTHSTFSRAFLKPENRDMAAQMYDFACKGVFVLPEYGLKTGWQSIGTYNDGPFQLGARTHLGFWEYLKEDPARLKLFNSGMRSETTTGNGRRSGAYPFGDELDNGSTGDDDVLIVDVGGGRGQVLEAIKHDYPHLNGRFILQDLPDVIEDAKMNGLPSFIEPHVGSFFEPQVIKGAHIYYFRRILHDWDQHNAHQILTNTRSAMTVHSRILIAEMVLPIMQAPRAMALQDLNMMSFGGMERTESQWAELIASSDLRLRKIWRGEGGPKHSVIEAVLPEFRE